MLSDTGGRLSEILTVYQVFRQLEERHQVAATPDASLMKDYEEMES